MRLTDQEKRIIRALMIRPAGWSTDDLLDELSRGRRDPMTAGALSVHLHNLRRQGYAIKCRHIYTLDSFSGLKVV